MKTIIKIDRTKLQTVALRYRIKNGDKWNLMNINKMTDDIWISLQTWYNVSETGNSYTKTADKLTKVFGDKILK